MMPSSFFSRSFGSDPSATIFVPGRVNLIGEHIDYNGGMVLPFAIGRGVTVEMGRCEGNQWIVASDRFDEVYRGAIGQPSTGWSQHAVAALRLAADQGWLKEGRQLALASDLPDGAGLSSSAAVIVGVLKAIRATEGLNLTDTEIAVQARRVETDYLGVPVGIMDQMAVAIASPGEAILLDTAALTYKTRPLPSDLAFVPLHSGIRRELSDGRYRERKEECDLAKAYFGTDDICHLSPEAVEGA